MTERVKRRAATARLGGLLALALFAVACPAAPFSHDGPTTRPGAPAAPTTATTLPRAMPPPRLDVTPAGPLVGGLVDATVLAHTPAGGGAQRLTLATAEGDVEITYALGGDLRLSVEVAAHLRVRYYPARDAIGGSALVVAASDGRALGVITRRDGLPSGVLPGGARVELRDAPGHLAYTEVSRVGSQCLIRVERFDLALTTSDEATRWVPPGGVQRVTIANTPFDLVAYDASRLVDATCRGEDPTHTSWALLAVSR